MDNDRPAEHAMTATPAPVPTSLPPTTPALTRKHSATASVSGDSKWKASGSHPSGAAAIHKFAGAMRELSSGIITASLAPPPTPASTVLSTPERLDKAIKVALDDNDMDRYEKVDLIARFSSQPTLTQTYLSISDPDIRADVMRKLSN